MGKLMRHLKPHILSILGIVILLFVQAYCDLSLPDYMSDIVNVGIQQGGIKNAVPDIIRKTEMDKITFFMDENDKKIVLDNYALIEKGKASQDDMDKYSKKYPEINNTDVYKLNTKDSEVIDKINTAVGKPMLFVGAIEGTIKMSDNSSESNSDTANNSEMEKLFANVPPGTDPFTVIAQLPKEQLDGMMKTVNDKFAAMPDSIITQGAVKYVQGEYKALGRDTGNLQSNYIIIAGLKMLLISLISMAATVTVGLMAAVVAASVSSSLRKNVFENVVGFSNAEFDKFSTSSLITRSTNDIQQVQIFLVILLRIVFYAPILGIGGVIKVLNTDTNMTWVIGVAVLV